MKGADQGPSKTLTLSTAVNNGSEPSGVSLLLVNGEERMREPALLVFPTVGTGGTHWPLSAQQVNEWRDLFPGLDVLAEAKKALAWVKANPGKRKTAKGMPKFLVSWLTRTVDRGGANGSQRSAAAPRRLAGSTLQDAPVDKYAGVERHDE